MQHNESMELIISPKSEQVKISRATLPPRPQRNIATTDSQEIELLKSPHTGRISTVPSPPSILRNRVPMSYNDANEMLVDSDISQSRSLEELTLIVHEMPDISFMNELPINHKSEDNVCNWNETISPAHSKGPDENNSYAMNSMNKKGRFGERFYSSVIEYYSCGSGDSILPEE